MVLSPIRDDESRLKVYALLVEGRAASVVCEITGLDKGYVSRIASGLVKGKFLKPIKGCKKPILYEKGPRGPELDIIIVDKKLPSYARGVTDSIVKVDGHNAVTPTACVHHLKFKAKVNVEGQAPFLKEYMNRRKCEAGCRPGAI